ncbi:MAG: Response regulator receiver protein [Pedosphaera sp.]|nr:Response regulator receiver protein [Pedosphaera sp.]
MKKILIIEDDQVVASIYRNKFSAEGFRVEVAFDGESGFELIESFHPDVVILDLMLPRITGLDLLKRVRAKAGLAQLPIIVFSNTYLSNMVQDAWKAGATKCLSKANCTPKQVIEIVRSLVSPAAPAAPGAAPAGAATPADAPATPESDADNAFQSELRQSFIASLPGVLATSRIILQTLARTQDEPNRVKQLQELYRRIHSLTGNAGIAGMLEIALMADAVEALVKELYEKPKNINASTLRTVALAVDFLGVLFDRAKLPEAHAAQAPLKAEILVVDDEAISRRAITYALEKARLQAASVENPEIALQMLAEKSFDLVFLDVDMPGMNGFELCTKLRAMARNKSTPVVFVTSLTDFESRANSTMSGGNDLIAKPFLFIELTVKSLVYILRGRIANAKK